MHIFGAILFNVRWATKHLNYKCINFATS